MPRHGQQNENRLHEGFCKNLMKVTKIYRHLKKTIGHKDWNVANKNEDNSVTLNNVNVM